uniref:Protein amnionless n=1 Tax=Parascaris univalens TaxID=6257 RepID=A0A914ZJ09_PARUN
ASILIGNVIATVYFFRPINNLEYAINWENSVVPCEDDRIRFDEEKIAVTMINEPIAVSEMSLPDDGIIFFAPNTALGQKGRWQCERKITPEDAFFQTKPAASFFSGSNWFASLDGEEIGHLLHALQIPSDQDTAVIQVSGANRMLIDDFVKLDSFLFSDEMVIGKSFDLSTLWTMEGQFQFVLAPKLKSDVIIDDIAYQWPKFTNTVTLLGPNAQRNPSGIFNSNAEPNIMKIICSYQRCPAVENICVTPFQPVGHCCFICGSMLTFRGNGINFEKLSENLHSFQTASAFAHIFHLGVSLLRIDHNDIIPEYQIVVSGPSDAAFDERVFSEVLQEVIEVLYNSYDYTNTMSLFDLKKTCSKDLRGFGISDAIVVLFFLCVISAVIFGIAIKVGQYHTDPRIRELILESSTIRKLTVRWRGNKREEDQLELLSGEIDDASEEECSRAKREDDCTHFTNISFDEGNYHEDESSNMDHSVI